MPKLTIKDKVLAVLLTQGYISNVDCVTGKHGFICLRLGAVIFTLVKEKKIELDKEKSGYLGDTKNWVYWLKKRETLF